MVLYLTLKGNTCIAEPNLEVLLPFNWQDIVLIDKIRLHIVIFKPANT